MSRGKPNKLKIAYALLAAVLLSLTLLISAAPHLGLPIPAWSDLFEAFGIEIKAENAPFSLHVIDVGQGDCILVKSGGTAMLVDAGSRGNDAKILAYLKKQDVKRLDFVVATHPHEDHIGSLDKIISAMDIGEIIMPRMSSGATPTTRTYESLLDEVEKKGMTITAAKAGLSFDLGDAAVRVLSPIKDYGNDYNNMSAVLHIQYKQCSFMLVGDAESKVEKDIIGAYDDIEADVLKVGHHGSKTSTTGAFLEAVNPRYAVISVGAGNSYNHPDDSILDRLRAGGIKYFRTDLNGTVMVLCDGTDIEIKTEK